MTKKLVLLGLLILVAPAAFAQCVDCLEILCPPTYTFDAPQCTPFEAYGKGYRNCKNVGTCGGCMGWTCQTRDPIDLSVVERPALVPESVKIEHLATAEEKPAPRNE